MSNIYIDFENIHDKIIKTKLSVNFYNFASIKLYLFKQVFLYKKV